MGSLARSSISSGSVRKPTIRPSISSCLRLIRPMRKWELSMTLWSGCLTRRRFRRCLIRMRRRCFRRLGASFSPRRLIPRKPSWVRASFRLARVSYRGLHYRKVTEAFAVMDPSSSELRVYNTLTRRQDKFTPIRPNRVNMFVCGPTVWDVSHIGHGKTYVAYDIIARYLRRKGFSVFFLLNITDVDDKII